MRFEIVTQHVLVLKRAIDRETERLMLSAGSVPMWLYATLVLAPKHDIFAQIVIRDLAMKDELTNDDSRIDATHLEQVLDLLDLFVFTVQPHEIDGLNPWLEHVQPMENDLRNAHGQRGLRRTDKQLTDVSDGHRILQLPRHRHDLFRRHLARTQNLYKRFGAQEIHDRTKQRKNLVAQLDLDPIFARHEILHTSSHPKSDQGSNEILPG